MICLFNFARYILLIKVNVSSDLVYGLNYRLLCNEGINKNAINKIQFVKNINLLHVLAPLYYLQRFFQFREIQYIPEVFI